MLHNSSYLQNYSSESNTANFLHYVLNLDDIASPLQILDLDNLFESYRSLSLFMEHPV